jgi:predicted membrane protein
MSAYWVKSALPPRMGPMPAWVVIPMPYMLFNFGVVSIAIVLITLALAIYLTSKGRTMMWTIRRIRTFLRNHKTDARPLGYRRAVSMDVAMHDFNFERWRKL